ncbi:hypothetical protein [Escherichia coli]|uniref:hypothetical protein n=1 Tax=Escherichia coli TaxID=562 RepID=UPI0018DF3EA1|nr:hypothetical protein [Escherichia coli]
MINAIRPGIFQPDSIKGPILDVTMIPISICDQTISPDAAIRRFDDGVAMSMFVIRPSRRYLIRMSPDDAMHCHQQCQRTAGWKALTADPDNDEPKPPPNIIDHSPTVRPAMATTQRRCANAG